MSPLVCVTARSAGATPLMIRTLAEDVNVFVPAQQLNKDVWVANGLYQVNEKRNYEKAVLMDFVVKSYQQNPSAKPADVLKALNAYQKEYRERITTGGAGIIDWQTTYDVANSMFNIIGTVNVPGVATAVAVAKESLFWAQKGMQASLAPEDQLLGQNQLFRTYVQFSEYQKEVLASGYDLAKGNPNASLVINTFFAPDLNATTVDTATQILNKNPSFASSENIKDIRAMIGPDGTITVTLKNLQDLSKAQFNAWKQVISDQQATAKAVDEKQKTIIEYLKNQQAQAEAQALAAKQRELAQLKLEAGEASIYLLSTFIGLVDKGLGNKIATVGNAALQIANSISKYNDTISRLGQAGAGFASVVMTANIVAAGLSLISLFGGGPSPEEMILEEVRELRKQIAQLGQVMMERFDRIDKSLHKIYETLNTRLDQIDLTLGKLTGSVEDIQRSLYDVESTLNRVERNIKSWLVAGFRRDLIETINGTLNYKENFGINMDYSSQFVPREIKFYTWAVSNSQDPLEAGVTKPVDDFQVYDVLTNFPLENNINYLSQFLSTRFPTLGLPPLASQTLSNPRDWSLSSEAYMRLAAEWPQHYKKVSGCRIEQIYNRGREVQSALQRISTVTTGNETKANYQLFDVLMANYQAKAAALKTETQNTEAARKAELKLQLANAWSPKFSPIQACPGANTNGVNEALSVPGGLDQLIPNLYRASERFGLGSMQICYDSVTWSDQRTYNKGYSLGNPQTCMWLMQETVGKLTIVIRATLNGQTVFRRSLKSNQENLFFAKFLKGADSTGGSCPVPVLQANMSQGRTMLELSTAISKNWNGGEVLRDRFIPTASELTSNDELEKALVATNADLDNALRNQLNQIILNDLNKASSLQRAARELSGAKMLLDAFISLGLSRSLERNDLLRSLLFGSQRVLEETAIKELYQDALLAANKDPHLQIKVDISGLLDQRAEALRAELRKILDDIDQKKFAEGYRLIDTTLMRIEIMKKEKKCP